MKDKKADWTADEKTFTDGLQATKDMIATDPAGAQAKVDELKSIIDKWDNAFKEMAAAPAKTDSTEKEVRFIPFFRTFYAYGTTLFCTYERATALW